MCTQPTPNTPTYHTRNLLQPTNHRWNDVLDLDYTLDDDQDTDYTDEDSVTSQQNANSTSTQSRTPRRRKTPKQVPMEALPKVAIVGRPNVGKSALFNRVTKTTKAIVYDYPGVTRDRLYTRAFWGDREFVVVDTGGLVSDADALARGEVVREPLTSAGEWLIVRGWVGAMLGDRDVGGWCVVYMVCALCMHVYVYLWFCVCSV